MKKKYSTVIISDTHLGKPNAQTKKLLEFLQDTEIETLIINGDLIDFRQLSFLGKRTDKETNIMNHLVERVNNGMKMIYVKWNHDAFIKKLHHMHFSNMSIVNELIFTTKNNKRYYLCHGDRFDFINHRMPRLWKTLNLFYTTLYLLEKMVNKNIDEEWYVPHAERVKLLFKKFLFPDKKIHRKALRLAKKKNCDGTVLGHYHRPDHIRKWWREYLNTGDRVTSCSAVVENKKWNLELIYQR